MNDDNEIIEIGIDSMADEKINIKKDIEKEFSYANPFFFTIAAILIGIFIIQIQSGLYSLGESIDLNNFTYKYSNYSEGGNIFGIFTSMFLHGSLGHIIGNLLFFYLFSLVIYRLFSLNQSLLLFVVLGVLSGIPGYFLNDIPSIGASGAIFGLFGIATSFYFLHKNTLENNLGDIAGVLLFLAGYQIFLGAITPIVDNIAHISGYFGGIIIGYFLLKDKDLMDDKSLLEEL